jgi:dephospho-CoA kinase
VIEVPLLFEGGREAVFDTTVSIVAAEDVRRERAAARGHALVDAREARQLTQEEKADRAAHVVVNDGSVTDLEAALSALLAKLQG